MVKDPFTGWHVGVAAEAATAALFARCGLDISVQYGANQPEYDLIAVRAEYALKISVKGSKDGGWGLLQSYLPKQPTGLPKQTPNYHLAAENWLAKHSRAKVFCFVQFLDAAIDAMPRVYLATPSDVAERLKQSCGGRGDTIWHERRIWTARAVGAGTTDEIPTSWAFSQKRIDELFQRCFPLLDRGT